jgi:Fe-S-cluster formation regulator IscX/YfhJ
MVPFSANTFVDIASNANAGIVKNTTKISNLKARIDIDGNNPDVDLRQMVIDLEEFDDDKDKSGEKILEAIQMHWIEDRNNHQKPTFHPLGDFLNPALALLGQGLKKSPIGQKLDFANHPYLCKGLQ